MTMLGVTILVSIIFVPAVLKSLTGNNRILFILRQFWVVIYLIMTLLFSLTTSKTSFFMFSNRPKVKKVFHILFPELDFEDFETEHKKDWDSLSINQVRLLQCCLELAQTFSYHKFYFLSLLQSIDVYVMICEPFRYEEFCKKLLKYLTIGAGLCLVTASEQMVTLFFELYYIALRNDRGLYVQIGYHRTHENFFVGLSVFSFVKAMLIKLAYSLVVVRLAWLTRAGLINSNRLLNRNSNLHVRIFYFSLIPLFLSAISTVHEVLELYLGISKDENSLPGHHIITGIQASVIMIGTFFYCGGYLILFSNLRKIVLCKA